VILDKELFLGRESVEDEDAKDSSSPEEVAVKMSGMALLSL